MRVSRDRILQAMLKHKAAFYTLLDYVQAQGGSAEIPQGLYIQQYYKHIVGSEDAFAIRVLTLDSLYKNGIIVHLDMQAGTLTLQSFVIDLLRFIDTSRVRELSAADFEHMREQFQSQCAAMEDKLTLAGHPDYEEAKVTLFDLIDQTLSKIQQNVEGLTAQVNKLGERYEHLDHQGFNAADSQQLLDDASKLYERFISPCNAFLSPSMIMRDGKKSFTQSMRRLYEVHEHRGESYTGFRIRYKLTAIRSYYKDIADMQRRVQRYTQTLAAERGRYNAIEKSYNQLMDAVVDLRHGKLRGTKLATDAAVFQQNVSFLGLKKRLVSNESRLNWYNVNHVQRLDEWLQSISVDESKHENNNLQPIPEDFDIKEQRRQDIMRLCIQRPWPDASGDVIAELHVWLAEILEDHTLFDTLVAYQYTASLPKLASRMRALKQRKRVDDGRYYFVYLCLSLTVEHPSVTRKKDETYA